MMKLHPYNEMSAYQELKTSATHLSPFNVTRSYAALRAADLDWIVGQGYSSGGYILEKNHEKPTWNHKNYGKPTWNHEKPTWNHEKP